MRLMPLSADPSALIAQAADDTTRHDLCAQTSLSIRKEHGCVLPGLRVYQGRAETCVGADGKPMPARAQQSAYEVLIDGRRAGYILGLEEGTPHARWMFAATNDDGPMANPTLAGALSAAATAIATGTPLDEGARDAFHVWYAECQHNADISSKKLFGI